MASPAGKQLDLPFGIGEDQRRGNAGQRVASEVRLMPTPACELTAAGEVHVGRHFESDPPQARRALFDNERQLLGVVGKKNARGRPRDTPSPITLS